MRKNGERTHKRLKGETAIRRYISSLEGKYAVINDGAGGLPLGMDNLRDLGLLEEEYAKICKEPET
ncbi:MAG: hypothetical protein ISS93_00775 [Candidatus Aenigmarchaeota archaeon]|nr:hypothetical protein [Candidatus Aenigmarchaeota archaeon]